MYDVPKISKLSGFGEVFDVLDAISETSSRKEKSALLDELKDSGAAKYVFWLAMGTSKFYVTAKAVDPKTKQPHDAIPFFKKTDEAVREFLGIIAKLMDHRLKGNAAKAELNLFFFRLAQSRKVHSSAGKYLLAVLDKKLRLGVDTSVMEVWPDIIDAFGVPKGKALYKQKTGAIDKSAEKMLSYPCDVEPKKDGYNISIECDLVNGTAVALSSDNMKLPALQEYADAILVGLKKTKLPKKFAGSDIIVIDGECESRFVLGSKQDSMWSSSWGKTSALVKAGLKKTGFDAKSITKTIKVAIDNDLLFTLYEAYPKQAHTTLFKCPRAIRRTVFESVADRSRALVKRQDSVTPIPYRTCKNRKELEAQHTKNIEAGEEGSIIRMPDVGVLADSKWRGNFIKYKEYTKEDAVILGVLEGEGRNAGSAGAFVCWLPDKNKLTKVTVPTDAVKAWAWKNRRLLHGFYIEITGAKDKTGLANASRNPVLARFRDDCIPMPLKKTQELCQRFKQPIPSVDNMDLKMFSSALARIAK